MRIGTYEELKHWNLSWPARAPGPWELTRAGVLEALGDNQSAIGVYWIGFSRHGTHASFEAKYCGKAVRQPLYWRLHQHLRRSHNEAVRRHLDPGVKGLTTLRFRFVEFATPDLADVAEGVLITAFRGEYEWNRRNEWRQHWVLEGGHYPEL